MGRLINWPHAARFTNIEPVRGPRTAGDSESESMYGNVQTVSSPFGFPRFRFTVRPMNGKLFRRYKGTILAGHGGANAFRMRVQDPDKMTHEEAGVVATPSELSAGVPWSNDEPWSNGQNWQISRPTVVVAASAALGASVIYLNDEFWGHELGLGDMIGFFPLHFGWYWVTEVQAAGQYRIWPPLSKAVTAGDRCTLEPVAVVRLTGESAASLTRGLVVAEGCTVEAVMVPDPDVRNFFAD